MECPRCHHPQDEEIECAACGVIFAKYQRRQEALQKKCAAAPGTPRAAAPRRWIAWLGIVGLGAVTAALFSILGRSDQVVLTGNSERPETSENAPFTGLADRLTAEVAPASAVERASLATVNIKTPWGLGSGFFINAGCQIVTNRHVVDMEWAILELEKQIVSFEKSIRSGEQTIQIHESVIKRGGLADQDLAAVKLDLAEKRKKVGSASEKLRELRARKEKLQLGGERLVVKIVDGTDYPTRGIEMSLKHDLALLQIEEEDCPFLKIAPDDALPLGMRVHALGSRLGLEDSVVSGFLLHFASELRETRKDWMQVLQTNLAVNPSNSGGPLINELGHVLGVITLHTKRRQVVGFAIPIHMALSDLGIEVHSLASR